MLDSQNKVKYIIHLTKEVTDFMLIQEKAILAENTNLSLQEKIKKWKLRFSKTQERFKNEF